MRSEVVSNSFSVNYAWGENLTWNELSHLGCKLTGYGRFSTLSKLVEQIGATPSLTVEQLGSIISEQFGHFAGVVETEYFVCAFVDHVRSIPFFYSNNKNGLVLSNNARNLKDACGLHKVNENALIEFRMAGYVTGGDTIYSGLHQLQAGELLYFDKKNHELTFNRYFIYKPKAGQIKSHHEYVEELESITTRVFERTIENAQGAPIWVPLSGGLDSRLIVCQLKKLGYDNLHTFSYGPAGNYEAKAAKIVADVVGVPWQFVCSKPSRAKAYFNSSSRKKYWEFADGASSYPVMNEYESLHTLRENGQLTSDAIIINGQSGDFLSGGHIPIDLLVGACSANNLVQSIIKKHYSIWQKNEVNNNMPVIERKILDLLGIKESSEFTMEEIAAIYEQWEWQERQAKWVVNGQRLYDFMGFKWELPLWDGELTKFWATVPLNQRLKQSLFIDYLEDFNYEGLFKGYSSEARRWPHQLEFIMNVAYVLSKILKTNPDTFQKYASYWGHYADQYSLFGLKYFLQNIGKATVPPQGRGAIALGLTHWIKENSPQD